MADEPAYALHIDSSVEASRLTIIPVIAAPAGSRLRYEMISSKEGGSGRSSTRQSGGVLVGADGTAQLSTLKLGVGAADHYVITVKVYDGAKLVAEGSFNH
jgi:Thin aggregative fimbriae synthesis protein